MATKLTFIGAKPAATSGSDVQNAGAQTVAVADQNIANLQAAVDAALPSATAVVGGGASTVPRLDASGNALFGVPNGSCHIISKNVAEGVAIADISNVGALFGTTFYGGSAYGYNAAATIVTVAKNGTTSRSINAGGTINASGADYAEYERKSATCGDVAKGQIIGFDANGEVTDKWADAISFGVKSTNPNLVGGDTWGNIGPRPQEPADGEDAGTHAADLAAFEVLLEAERQKVDRIAYSGKVPCNVVAAVGDYIIAAQDGEGIKGETVADPAFSQYRLAVGRVRRILDDGRPEIAVIVH